MFIDYNLLYSNGFNNRKKEKTSSLLINGDCKITNYDPRESDGNDKGLITIDFKDGKKNINNGLGGKKSKNQKIAEFSDKKFSIFSEIAKLDGKEKTLSVNDIFKIDNLDKKKFGIQNIKKDFKAGVATLIFGKNNILRIDFETPNDKLIVSKPEKTISNTQTDSKKSYSELAKSINNPKIFDGLPKTYDKYITRTAKKTGFSEYFIKYILSTEHYMPVVKDIGDGCLTGGFGHTNRAESNSNIKKNQKVSLSTAFKWLEQDLKDKEKIIKKNFEDYKKYPKSMREALVDIAYNRGKNIVEDEEIYRSLKANLQLGDDYLPAAAVRVRQEDKLGPKFGAGIRKRNVYRFLLAIRDFTPENKLAAIRRFRNSDDYYLQTIKTLNQKGFTVDAKNIEILWNDVKQKAELDSRKTR